MMDSEIDSDVMTQDNFDGGWAERSHAPSEPPGLSRQLCQK